MRAARLAFRSHAGFEAADSNDLVPGPDSDGEGEGEGAESAAQNGIGAIVEQLERWNDTAMTDLLDVLRGWEKFNFGGVLDRGFTPAAKIMWPRISKEGDAKTHFSRFMTRPLEAKGVKKASRWQRCVCLSGEPMCESSMYANTPSKPSVVRSIIL
jgi:hypothetical protein